MLVPSCCSIFQRFNLVASLSMLFILSELLGERGKHCPLDQVWFKYINNYLEIGKWARKPLMIGCPQEYTSVLSFWSHESWQVSLELRRSWSHRGSKERVGFLIKRLDLINYHKWYCPQNIIAQDYMNRRNNLEKP